jgi:hypothetical protein
MLEEQSDAIEEIRIEQEEVMDITMTDNNESTPKQQQHNELTMRGVPTALVAGDFDHQFNINKKRAEKPGSSAPSIGANRQ